MSRRRSGPCGKRLIQPREALVLFAVLVAASFVLVLFTNATTIAPAALAIATSCGRWR